MSEDAALTNEQKRAICSVLRLGCARPTACHFVGATERDLDAELQRDAAFAREALRSEAVAEITHLGNIHKAAQDEKNWRTSAWWLQRRTKQRASGESAEQSRSLVAEMVDELARIIVAEVPDAAVQRRLIERLLRVVAGETEPAAAVAPFPLLLPAPEA